MEYVPDENVLGNDAIPSVFVDTLYPFEEVMNVTSFQDKGLLFASANLTCNVEVDPSTKLVEETHVTEVEDLSFTVTTDCPLDGAILSSPA